MSIIPKFLQEAKMKPSNRCPHMKKKKTGIGTIFAITEDKIMEAI